MAFSVVLNSCVLEHALVRDVLVRAYAAGLYRASWSDKILEKAAGTKKSAPVRRLGELFPECLISAKQYEPLISTQSGGSDSAELMALCARAQAQVIVAMDPTLFTETSMKRLGVEAQHPDEFLCSLLDLNPAVILEIIVALAADMRRPPSSTLDLLERLGTLVPHFASSVLYLLPAEMRTPT